MTTNDHVVRYHEHVSAKSYEELIADFEDAVDAADPAAIADTLTAASNSTDSRQIWETATKSLPGSSGFARILALNAGELTSWYGKPAKAKMYIMGNPTHRRHHAHSRHPGCRTGTAANPYL